MSSASELAESRQVTRESWSAALRMIRETVETLGPPGILPSQDVVLALYGPEPVHEATAIVEALRKLLAHWPHWTERSQSRIVPRIAEESR